ncbi:MAG: extracellular solute-binding protein [Candidatus Methylomirabilota bacterium]
MGRGTWTTRWRLGPGSWWRPTSSASTSGTPPTTMFKAAKNKEGAWKFMTFLMEDEPNYEYAKALGLLPARKALTNRPPYTEPSYSGFVSSFPFSIINPYLVYPGWGGKARLGRRAAVPGGDGQEDIGRGAPGQVRRNADQEHDVRRRLIGSCVASGASVRWQAGTRFAQPELPGGNRAESTRHDRGARPASLGPGLPEPPPGLPALLIAGHQLPRDARVVARSILGGLHHEYGLEKLAA